MFANAHVDTHAHTINTDIGKYAKVTKEPNKSIRGKENVEKRVILFCSGGGSQPDIENDRISDSPL